MKKQIFLIIMITAVILLADAHRPNMFPEASAAYAQQSWQTLKGKHFIVYYVQGKSEAKTILHKAGNYYATIARELGYPRYAKFWTWDKRVKIYIYPTHESYIKNTKRPEWSHGMADYDKKVIISYRWGEGFEDTILPHEIAHLIFRDFVGFKSDIPLWLDEGVAQWAEAKNRNRMKQVVGAAFELDELISLDDMMRMDLASISKYTNIQIRTSIGRDGKKGVLFLSVEGAVRTYYLQAVSLIGFVIERYGSLKFADFCRQLKEGHHLEEAIKRAYSPQMKNLYDLEKNWVKYLKEGSK